MAKGTFKHKSNHHQGARSTPAAPAAAILPMSPMPIKTQGSRPKPKALQLQWTICRRPCKPLCTIPNHSMTFHRCSNGARWAALIPNPCGSTHVHRPAQYGRCLVAGCPRASGRGCQAACPGPYWPSVVPPPKHDPQHPRSPHVAP